MESEFFKNFHQMFGTPDTKASDGTTAKGETSKKIMPSAKKVERKQIDFQSHMADKLPGESGSGKTKTSLLTMLNDNSHQNKSGEKIIAAIDVENEHILNIWLDDKGFPIVSCHGGAFDGYYVLYNGFCFGPYPETITHFTPIRDFPLSFKLRKNHWTLVKEDGIMEIISHQYIACGTNGQFAYCDFINDGFYVDDGYTKKGPYKLVRYISFSTEGSLAYIIEEDNESYVYCDGEKTGPYDSVEYLRFADDGKLIYKTEEGGDFYVYYDAEKIGPYSFVDDLEFSPAGLLFFQGERYGSRYLYYNGEEYAGYDTIDHIHFTDTGSIVYTAQRNDSWYLCSENNESNAFDDVKLFVTSDGSLINNGEVFAFKIDDKWYIHDSYNKFGPFEDVFDVLVDPNNELLLHVGINGGECVLYGQKRIGAFEKIQVCKRWFEVTGEIIYSYKRFSEGYYVFNGKNEMRTLGQLSNFAVSHDGSRFAFTINEKKRGDEYVIIGTEKIGPFDRISYLGFSDDNSTLIMSVDIAGQSYRYCDDMQYGPFNHNMAIEYSSDGKTLSYAFEDNKQQYSYAIVDGNTYPGTIYNGKALYGDNGKIILRG